MSRWQELKYTLTGVLEHWAPKPTFSTNHIPDLTGRVCLVTGGYSGIGKEITRALLQHNATTYVAGRTRSKAMAVIEELEESTGKTARFLEVDLGSIASVRAAAEEFMRTEPALHVLFNNAAINAMGSPKETLTVDGYDLQFGTNVIGPWLFTELLIPALRHGKGTSPDGFSRIVTTSSSGAYFTPLYWDTFTDTPARKKLSMETRYFQSKLANTIIAHEFAMRYNNYNIVSIAGNPGNIATEIDRTQPKLTRWILRKFVLYPATMGALTPLFAGTMPEALKYNGEYLRPWARIGRCRDEVYDREVGQRLWAWLEEEVRKH